MTPFLVLTLGILFVVVLIAVLKIHPFIALLLAAIAVNFAATGEALNAVESAAADFGTTVGAVGIVIVLAALIGHCMLAGGGADRITRALLSAAGEKRASTAFLASGYALSIPVFFDTVFFLLIPLVRALHRRTGRDYVLCVMAVCAGAVVTHSLAPPTPGPLIMVETLPGLNLGTTLIWGTLLGIVPALTGGLLYGGMVNRSRSFAGFKPFLGEDAEPESSPPRLPGLAVSLVPLALPVLLISGDSFLRGLEEAGLLRLPSEALEASAFLGNRNIALFLAAFAAMATLKRQRGLPMARLREDLEPALMTGAMIVLITSAGGAFGKALSNLRIGDSLAEALGGFGGGAAPLLLLAWGLAAVLKTAQGSGTVSMITASAILAGSIGADLPCHPIYLFAAIGFGSLSLSWMNDSGFWVVGKMSGFDERQTFQAWTLLLLVISVAGLFEVLALAAVLPFR